MGTTGQEQEEEEEVIHIFLAFPFLRNVPDLATVDLLGVITLSTESRFTRWRPC
jgi:hypothetical protein